MGFEYEGHWRNGAPQISESRHRWARHLKTESRGGCCSPRESHLFELWHFYWMGFTSHGTYSKYQWEINTETWRHFKAINLFFLPVRIDGTLTRDCISKISKRQWITALDWACPHAGQMDLPQMCSRDWQEAHLLTQSWQVTRSLPMTSPYRGSWWGQRGSLYQMRYQVRGQGPKYCGFSLISQDVRWLATFVWEAQAPPPFPEFHNFTFGLDGCNPSQGS